MEGILGEIRAFAGNYAPPDWQICDGSMLAINGFEALYSLLGTRYGGDGISNFALPDLRGRLAVGQGQGPGLTPRPIASYGGSEQSTLSVSTMPAHSHSIIASTVTTGSVTSPSSSTYLGSLVAAEGPAAGYLTGTSAGVTQRQMDETTVQNTGEGLPHNNLMPCLAISYIMCVSGGIYPPRPY